jgi:hypothetical protein
MVYYFYICALLIEKNTIMVEFETLSDCQDYLRSKSLKKGCFFYNELNGREYFTLEQVPFTYVDGYSIEVEITLRSQTIGEISVILPEF